MPRQVIINMQEKYPFGECEQGDDQTVRVLVRRKVGWSEQPETMLEKASFFRRLNQNCIIRLEQVLQQQQCLHLLYEYVPIRMQTWIKNINEKFIEGFCRQLIELGEYLAKCYISVQLALENVGMDENYKPKYFLDFDFQVNQGLDKLALRNNYHSQVLALFRPYVQSRVVPKALRPREESDELQEAGNSRALVARSSRNDNASSTLRLREKAVALQKQRKNESISVVGSQWDLLPSEKSRKQSILSSVSNIKISRLGRRIDEIKNKLRGIYSPEPLYLKHEQRSIEKGSNSIAFNWDTTEKVYTTSNSPRQDALQSQAFCSSIFREMQQEESMFVKFQQNLAKQLTKGLPLKKNESLKAKEYEQMKKSDDGYFKDFFQVLQDKPKVLALEAPPPTSTSSLAERTRLSTEVGKSLLRREERMDSVRREERIDSIRREERIDSIRREERMDNAEHLMTRYDNRNEGKMQKKGVFQLQNRVKSAINKSKNLINKFKLDK